MVIKLVEIQDLIDLLPTEFSSPLKCKDIPCTIRSVAMEMHQTLDLENLPGLNRSGKPQPGRAFIKGMRQNVHKISYLICNQVIKRL